MTEQKPTKFGIILKSAKTKQQKEEKKLYTIVSCCVSAIFLITIIVPLMSKGEDKSSGNSYKSSYFDLADLAVDDEAEQVLLEMQKYNDIPKQQIAGGLFDKKDKEARQEKDKKEGLPPAPDKEYKQARQRKQAKSSRGVSRPIYTSNPRTTTNTGSLTRSNMASGGGGSSSVGTTWTSPDKAGQKGSNTRGNTGNISTQQLVAATGAKGRASGLLHAIQESQKGANSQNADTAAQAAADAFTNNNVEAEEDENLKDGMDELAEQFNAEEFKKAANNNDLTDLKNEAEKEKEKQEAEQDPCAKMKNKMSFECYWGPALLKLGEKVIEAGVNIGVAYATKGAKVDTTGSGTPSGETPSGETPNGDISGSTTTSGGHTVGTGNTTFNENGSSNGSGN